MNATVVVYEVAKVVQRTGPAMTAVAAPATPPAKLDTFGVTARDEDSCKQAARDWLKARGMDVRSVSWGPGEGPKDPDRLIVYVHKGDPQ